MPANIQENIAQLNKKLDKKFIDSIPKEVEPWTSLLKPLKEGSKEEATRLCVLLYAQSLLMYAGGNKDTNISAGYIKKGLSERYIQSLDVILPLLETRPPSFPALPTEIVKSLGNKELIAKQLAPIFKDLASSYFKSKNEDKKVLNKDQLKTHIETLQTQLDSDFIQKLPKEEPWTTLLKPLNENSMEEATRLCVLLYAQSLIKYAEGDTNIQSEYIQKGVSEQLIQNLHVYLPLVKKDSTTFPSLPDKIVGALGNRDSIAKILAPISKALVDSYFKNIEALAATEESKASSSSSSRVVTDIKSQVAAYKKDSEGEKENQPGMR
jgi:hypothetical protein